MKYIAIAEHTAFKIKYTMLRILNPELFQGNLKKCNYFEGWYFKHVSKDLNHVFSFIPGISLSADDPHTFIQVINGITGKTNYITYPLKDFKWDSNKLYLKIGKSVFTDRFIDVMIENEDIKVSGRLEYKNIIKYPRTIISPGIMGWYSYVPFMECKHGIISVNHEISGILDLDGIIDMNEGKGYIEKDWGSSFPEAWIWIQTNSFRKSDTSFTFSVAKIPWLGKYFPGFISFLYFERNFYLFSSYNNSTLTGINYDGKTINLTLKNNHSTLKVTAVKNISGELRAPVSGKMSRRIKESIDSLVTISLYDKHNNLIYNDSAQRAGLEIIDEIFQYLKL
jgi:tocopherol cyclase